MTKEETTEILDLIEGSYKTFIMNRDKKIIFMAWHNVMKDQDYEKVYKKLMNWIMENSNPPAIKDLIYIDWRKKYEQH